MKSVLHFFTDYKGKRVLAGTLNMRDMVFRKKVKIRDKLLKHMAFGLDKNYMDDVFAYQAEKIELTVWDGDQIYEIDVATFKKYATLADVGKFRNRYYCSISHWKSRPLPPKGVKK